MQQLELNFQTPEPFDVRIIDAHDWIILRFSLLYGRAYDPSSLKRKEIARVSKYLVDKYDIELIGDAVDLLSLEYGLAPSNPEQRIPL